MLVITTKGWLFNGSTWGNTDVYISEKEGDYWSTPLNLGEKVNTGTERTPWLSEDQKTLYLSSNGYENKIDLDVYYFTREDVNNWTRWEETYKLTHLCTDQDDWGYKIYPSASFLSRARLLLIRHHNQQEKVMVEQRNQLQTKS